MLFLADDATRLAGVISYFEPLVEQLRRAENLNDQLAMVWQLLTTLLDSTLAGRAPALAVFDELAEQNQAVGQFKQLYGNNERVQEFLNGADAAQLARVADIAERLRLPEHASVADALSQYPDALKLIIESGSDFLDRELVALQETGLSTNDVVHLLDLFEDIPLFRGTTDGFPGNDVLQRLGISPASIDPLVATIFALEGKAQGGDAIVLIATQRGLGNPAVDIGNVRRTLEREVQVDMLPLEFQSKASYAISVDRARQILSEMGVVELPNSIRPEDSVDYLRNTPRMTPEQIRDFFRRATEQ
ncbi:hypothetical protein HJG54_17880 [Leptolyngbya sp. NK1-12]|uniref:Uncharacterized protein n=1 Tax=Leptolyngbya sp. NK1-12 TaxID=2547451 RepID=A0AA96WVP7_9CYAN|nr:hypothetical protein [Leptolyngbya sp. NK1-12]WNZ24537.1 hypothetical protein HJG54_17880 [Leptolyngbya sp. NK1-12]